MPFTPKVASPSSKETAHATQLSFQQGVRAITEIFEKTPPQESIQSKIEKFVEKNLPDLPIAHAVALCYRIAAVEVPRTKGFELPPLSIEETVPTQDPVCLPTIMAEVKTYISKYVVSPPEVINLSAYYAASTKVESQRTRQPSKRHGRKSLSAFLLPKQQEKLGWRGLRCTDILLGQRNKGKPY